MQITIGTTRLELAQGDITRQDTEAIVNAANSGLAGGGGVDGAIHRAGGPQIMQECRRIGGCPTGQAAITGGGTLTARYVIHAVGPIYDLDHKRAAQLLADAYRNSLQLAVDHHLKNIAFPSLSTGAYRYPVKEAAGVALEAVTGFLESNAHELELVRFVLFDAKTMAAYSTVLARLAATRGG